ncbi:hypothetical protein F5Y18DRAFT_392763 [Xylariaceae sp. FL1019]|nr:hypothetical protein F5Y18DRAFT_392763 [Xylariaceae sp. FL1019]
MNETSRTAESILDYLTVKNPKVKGSYKLGRQTDNPGWRGPTTMRPWKEFNFETMGNIFHGELMRECRKLRRIPWVEPRLLPDKSDKDFNEDSARAILYLCTQDPVNRALARVETALHPVFWTSAIISMGGQSDKSGEAASSSKDGFVIPDGSGLDTQPSRRSVRQKANTIKPIEKLPKEIKPGSGWFSLKEIKRPDGDVSRWIRTNKWAPIRQIYQQCLNAGCRYGCLLTTKEAFLIRIQPNPERTMTSHVKSAGKSRTPTNRNTMVQAATNDGLLEYVSIPWEAHRREGEDLEDLNTMTMNLAIWFQHILAGNSHEIDWKYRPLSEETLRNKEPNTNSLNNGSNTEPHHLRRQLVVEIPTLASSFASVARSETDSQLLPPPGGQEALDYLQQTFASGSDIPEVQSEGRSQKRKYGVAKSEALALVSKKARRGRPPKQSPNRSIVQQ